VLWNVQSKLAVMSGNFKSVLEVRTEVSWVYLWCFNVSCMTQFFFAVPIEIFFVKWEWTLWYAHGWQKIKYTTKKKKMKCAMWSIALCSAETWTITQADRERLSAFELWVWRRMEKISWADRVANDEVLHLQRVYEKRNILYAVQQCKCSRWIGCILKHGSLLQVIIFGRI